MDGTKYIVGGKSYIVGEHKINAGDQGYINVNILQNSDNEVVSTNTQKQPEKGNKKDK